MGPRGWLFLISTAALLGSALRAQSVARPRDLGPGSLLVARRDLPDPNFAETVVLIAEHNDKGTMGLVINRCSTISLARVLQELKAAKGRNDPVYMGGPVERTGVMALLRSRVKPDDAKNVFGDVYMVSSKELLEKKLAAGADSKVFRVYMGYAGWGAGQLEYELQLNSWFVFRGDADTIFDPEPELVWGRMIKRTEMQIAFRSTGLEPVH